MGWEMCSACDAAPAMEDFPFANIFPMAELQILGSYSPGRVSAAGWARK